MSGTASELLFRAGYGEGHPNVGTVLKNLASVRLARGEHASAEATARQAVEIFDAALAEGHWRTAEAESVLGACLAANGREEEGAALLERSYRVLREVKGEDARQTREARERLATFRAVASDRGYSPSEFESAARISSSER